MFGSRLAGVRWNALAAIAVACVSLISCGGNSSSIGTQQAPNIAGAWEFIAVSSNGSQTGIEVALTEGTVLVNGVAEADGQIAASSAQINFVPLTTVSQNINVVSGAPFFGGSCSATPTTSNSLGPGTVTALGSSMSFAFTANGSVFNVSATLSGDGKSVLNGTYTPQAGNACSDPGGTITGTNVSKISGIFVGQMCPLGASSATCADPQNYTDTATATVSESGTTLTVTLAFSAGPDSGTNLTLTGPVTGNAFTVLGTYQGQTITYYGYFEQVYDSTLQVNVPSLYFVNASDTSVAIGALGVPQT
jgi:hypothetical protein